MDWPPCGRPPQNQTTRVRDIVGVLFNSLTCIQNPQDLVNPDHSEGLSLHLTPGVVGEATIDKEPPNSLVLHCSPM